MESRRKTCHIRRKCQVDDDDTPTPSVRPHLSEVGGRAPGCHEDAWQAMARSRELGPRHRKIFPGEGPGLTTYIILNPAKDRAVQSAIEVQCEGTEMDLYYTTQCNSGEGGLATHGLGLPRELKRSTLPNKSVEVDISHGMDGRLRVKA